MIPERATWLAAVTAAARAPSPHNAQPARWALQETRLQLLADRSGWLDAGDPTGRDDFVALGMAWEAMTLALSAHGIRLAPPRMALRADDRSQPGPRLVATGDLSTGADADPLAAQQEPRRSYRGNFEPASPEQLLRYIRCVQAHMEHVVPIPEPAREQVAGWYDAAAATGLRNTAVARELYDFMRFSRRDPRWTRDGLAADCMMLSGFEAWGASVLMRPGMLALLGKAGLLGLVVSERAKVMSATGLVAIRAGSNETPFDTGRGWYRFWLAATAAGFAAVPMSALVDSPEHAAKLLALLPPGQKLVNVMRIGPTPTTAAPRSARRPVEELLTTAVSDTR